MALYIVLFLTILVIAVFIWMRVKKTSSDDSSSPKIKSTGQAQDTSADQTKAKAVTADKTSTPTTLNKKTAQEKTVKKPAPIQKPATPHKTAPLPVKKKTVRFSPSSPVIKQYETALNLQMIQAEKAGDEEAYIAIVKQNAVYMQACAMLQKGVNAKDREQVRASLIKIRGLIPPNFKAQ